MRRFSGPAPVAPSEGRGGAGARQCDSYGLAAIVSTRDVGRVFRMAENPEFGMVAVNGTSSVCPRHPSGGSRRAVRAGKEAGTAWRSSPFEVHFL